MNFSQGTTYRKISKKEDQIRALDSLSSSWCWYYATVDASEFTIDTLTDASLGHGCCKVRNLQQLDESYTFFNKLVPNSTFWSIVRFIMSSWNVSNQSTGADQLTPVKHDDRILARFQEIDYERSHLGFLDLLVCWQWGNQWSLQAIIGDWFWANVDRDADITGDCSIVRVLFLFFEERNAIIEFIRKSDLHRSRVIHHGCANG